MGCSLVIHYGAEWWRRWVCCHDGERRRSTEGKYPPCDVLGALTGEAGFNREQVGKITVTDMPTYDAVTRDIAREAVKRLNADKVKGKSVKVRALED